LPIDESSLGDGFGCEDPGSVFLHLRSREQFWFFFLDLARL
jgi:hypothetical protein